MSERPTDQELIEEVKSLLEGFRGEFVDHLEPVYSTPRTRLLQIFAVWRQVNLRRIVDLADAAIPMFEQCRFVPGCTLTRGVFETVGIQYYIHKKMVEYTEKSDPESLHKLFLSALFGRRDDASWPETVIQVLTAIDHMDKEFKMLRGEYDHLCEYAHPNLKGGFGAYVCQEGEELEAHFGTNPLGLDMATWGLVPLHVILVIAAEITIVSPVSIQILWLWPRNIHQITHCNHGSTSYAPAAVRLAPTSVIFHHGPRRNARIGQGSIPSSA